MRIVRALIPVILTLGMVASPTPSSAAVSIGISVGIAPPPLPVYEQPPIPGYGYVWAPGYWAYGPDGYYWVPGTWVLPPTVGFLWTPPWWGWSNGVYLFHSGYWGPRVGFYGGINYGYGYFGSGYEGGYWDRGRLFYNREVNNFGGRHITNVYSRSVENHGGPSRVSFNGGTGGVAAQPTAQEQSAARDHHVQPTALQVQHINAAGSNRSLLATTNHGQPQITATSRVGRFNTVGNAPSVGSAGGPRVQTNTHAAGADGGAPKAIGQSGSKNAGQGTPNTMGRNSPASFGQKAQTNSRHGAPQNLGRGDQETLGQRASRTIHPPGQGNGSHVVNQRVVTPNAQPSAHGAQGEGQRQGQSNGKIEHPGG